MADFGAPSGPPPPRVPEGWVARWNEQYKEWYYVNTYTKKSQWEMPTAPAVPPGGDDGPSGPPPSYAPGAGPAATDTKNPFGTATPSVDEDERLARQLQAEEDARARARASASAAPYASTPTPPAGDSRYPGELPPRPDSGGDRSRGLLGKLFGGKSSRPGYQGGQGQGSAYGYQQSPSPQPAQYGGGGYYQSPPPPPQPGYGGYPPQQGYPQQGYPPQGYPQQGYPPQGGYYGGGYAQQPMQQPVQQPKKSGGMGVAGGAALGLGAGLVGGMLLENALDSSEDHAYQEGYEDGQDNDYGGGDYDGDF